jgi:KR domain
MAIFEASEIEQSFRYLQKGDHIRKSCGEDPRNDSEIPSTSQARPFTLDREASYLLTGGLGGLGRLVATWMVESRARNLIFLSRSAGKGESYRSFFAELESVGCSISTVADKVEDMEAVEMAIQRASRPIKGIIHLAMVLRVCYLALQNPTTVYRID